ncbi:hypothetical protein HZZ00_37960 (plasmid) [Streptomyces sp. NEAU-sy36]|uniref:hypothetical protein n=1 Tax=unclassified Streptomyces TaxID=2593676 RepID=UPI0015D5FF2D|nr:MULTISPECIES: hypothetical protein [unclassified Streptomyces]QLJ06817.1 hypothetical protein HZZ00_37960 [Streptomyces sp. NEAU-sy36]
MTTVQTLITETELTDWLTHQFGPEIHNDYDTASHLLRTFDLAAKEGPSLNNRHEIANCIASTPNTDAPWTPVNTAKAAATLHAAYRITRKPTNHASLTIDLPLPIIVSRHQCPFCRRFTRADQAAVKDHMARCWSNPRLRCCKTCTHHQDAGPEDNEACTHPDGPEYEEYRFPVLHCPLWQANEALPNTA